MRYFGHGAEVKSKYQEYLCHKPYAIIYGKPVISDRNKIKLQAMKATHPLYLVTTVMAALTIHRYIPGVFYILRDTCAREPLANLTLGWSYEFMMARHYVKIDSVVQHMLSINTIFYKFAK